MTTTAPRTEVDPILEVVSVMGLATVQDAGRPGRMHEGIPPGGALVPELFGRANQAVGNPAGAPAIEWQGAITVMACEAPLVLATDEGRPWVAAVGERFTLEPSPSSAVRYLAVAGGLDVPEVLGGRGTLLVARLGGLSGRALRRGDRLSVGERPARDVIPPVARVGSPAAASTWAPEGPIRVVPGPDAERFSAASLPLLLSSCYRVSPLGDRTGTRLVGPPLGRCDADSGAPTPMVRGAIQVPAGGEPIVLGPDHPTTGGYPVIAVVLSADHGRLAARRPGAEVRFTAVTMEAAGRLAREGRAPTERS
ncbi:MAG TPA: biotin-dependent carboxyltransferase family protein [Polyangia bacterium]|jgi:biotin-dependent carboxylase-like uncharacterized protein|nr:biotin-dependent carboxyltransferase family protein [Polyangia bacterium]